MNNIVANVLLNMTCASRFEGDLNIDMNGKYDTHILWLSIKYYYIATLVPVYPYFMTVY